MDEKNHVSFIRMAACRSQDCVQAFIRSSALSGGTLAGNKRPQSFQSESEWSGKEKKKLSERNLSPYYAFLMPLSLCSHSSCLSPPFHHFPLGSDKEELALVPPFLHAFQGYPSASFSPPVSVWRSASLHPSLFVSSSSLFLSPLLFCLHLSALNPLSIPTRLSWPPCRQSNCSWPVIAQRKADIQLRLSSYWGLKSQFMVWRDIGNITLLETLLLFLFPFVIFPIFYRRCHKMLPTSSFVSNTSILKE